MRTIAAAIVIAALATPTYAQVIGTDIQHPKTDEEIKKEQSRENAYRSGVGKIPDQKAVNDPWGEVRSDSKASQAKASQPKASQSKASAGQSQKTKPE
jgi:hypothetical protein